MKKVLVIGSGQPQLTILLSALGAVPPALGQCSLLSDHCLTSGHSHAYFSEFGVAANLHFSHELLHSEAISRHMSVVCPYVLLGPQPLILE